MSACGLGGGVRDAVEYDRVCCCWATCIRNSMSDFMGARTDASSKRRTGGRSIYHKSGSLMGRGFFQNTCLPLSSPPPILLLLLPLPLPHVFAMHIKPTSAASVSFALRRCKHAGAFASGKRQMYV